MTSRGRAFGAAFLLFALAALVWLVLPRDSEPDADGRLRISEAPTAPSPPAIVAGPAPTPAKIERHAISAPLNGDRASEQSYRLSRETRDRDWADRSEAAIRTAMRSVGHADRIRFLDVACKASICEVSGVGTVDPVTGSLKPLWEALERDTAGDAFLAHGLERTATLFDTGRSPEQFLIHYRRADPLQNQTKGTE